MSTAVKRACDACHRRKVKCDGINPCRNCSSAQLSCTYNAIPQKKGPKGSRAKVISELRENQRQTSLSAKIHNTLMNHPPEGPPPQTMSLKATPGLLSMETIKTAIDFYFEHMYGIAPILNKQRIMNQAACMDQNQSMDTYCLMSSLAAWTMIQPGAPLPGGDNGFNLASIPGAHVAATQILIDETVRIRKGLDCMMNPTFNSLCTSYFLFAANFSLEYHDQAWYHLREAITVMLMHKMHMEETYLKFDPVEASRRRRLFWLFFCAERHFALKHGESRPLSLQATINLPTHADDPTDPQGHQIGGFLALSNLFCIFDLTFTQQWNRIRSELDASHIQSLVAQFNKVSPTLANLPNPMEDLIPNQNWLKNIDWRIRLQEGTLNDNDQEAQMAIQFGNDYTADVTSMQNQFTGDRGLIRKLFNVSFSLTEYLKNKPQSRNPLTRGPREHLHELLNILSVLRNRDHRFLPYLLTKLNEILPKLPSPKLEEVPEALAQNLANIDIFDGFGNLGMAPMDFDEKKYMSDMSTSAPMSIGGPAVSIPDMSSPFSPAIMSPGMEFPPQALQDFNTPMEMTMSPVGGGPTSNMQNLSPGMMQPPAPSTSQPQGQQPLPQPMVHHQPINPQQMQQMNMGMMQNQMMGRSAGPQSYPHAPQRTSSFAGPPVLKTVGDFQALQRVKTEPHVSQLGGPPQQGMHAGLNGQMNMNMGEIDFSNLR